MRQAQGQRMSDGYGALTEKEKETLRLIVRGHDAKSMARHLGLSVHTVNERLRDARRKLSVSSSREAARLVLDREGYGPESMMDKTLGGADTVPTVGPSKGRATNHRSAWIAVVIAMSLIFATLAFNAMSSVAAPPAVVAETEEVRSARAWLALVDEGRWDESWNATASAFRALNTSPAWASVSEQARTPLGAVTSRTVTSQETLPAPPHGYEVIKFRTSFAGKPSTTETVSLVREKQEWKVVGYLIG